VRGDELHENVCAAGAAVAHDGGRAPEGVDGGQTEGVIGRKRGYRGDGAAGGVVDQVASGPGEAAVARPVRAGVEDGEAFVGARDIAAMYSPPCSRRESAAAWTGMSPQEVQQWPWRVSWPPLPPPDSAVHGLRWRCLSHR
jgi:hypothetical protein